MSKDRLWAIAAVAAMLVIAVAGWFLGIAPVLQQTSAADTQTSSIVATNASSAARLSSLKTQFANIGPLREKLAALRESIPEDAGASVFLREINALSAKYGVTLKSVAINSATVFAAPVVATPTTGAAGSTSTPTPTPSPTATAPTTATTPAAAPADPFVLVPVSIVVSGRFDAVRDFVGAIQGGSRLYLATSVSIAAASAGDPATGTLSGDIFTLQGSSPSVATAAPVTPTTPEPSATPTAIPTGVPTGIPTSTPIPTTTPKP